jgi:hypothetical protein
MAIRNRPDPQKVQEQRLRYIVGRSGHPRLLQLGCAIALPNGTVPPLNLPDLPRNPFELVSGAKSVAATDGENKEAVQKGTD